MGWFGYGLYDGDGTRTSQLEYLKWAKVYSENELDDKEEEICKRNKTVLPPDKKAILERNYKKILKKMCKPYFKVRYHDKEYNAIDWQMLLALFVDNNLKAPFEIYEIGIASNTYLMDEAHAADFDKPHKRRATLKRFEARAMKNQQKTRR